MALGYFRLGLALLLAGLGPGGLANAQELTDIATNLALGTTPLVVKLTPEPVLASAPLVAQDIRMSKEAAQSFIDELM